MDDLLSVEMVAANGRVELLVSGELDFASRSTLDSAVLRLLKDSEVKTITLNLADLRFCDAAGVHAFAAAQREAAAQSKTLALANIRPTVAFVLDVVQFDRVLPIDGRSHGGDASGDADSSATS